MIGYAATFVAAACAAALKTQPEFTRFSVAAILSRGDFGARLPERDRFDRAPFDLFAELASDEFSVSSVGEQSARSGFLAAV